LGNEEPWNVNLFLELDDYDVIKTVGKDVIFHVIWEEWVVREVNRLFRIAHSEIIILGMDVDILNLELVLPRIEG
jgi:hypothetical protein